MEVSMKRVTTSIPRLLSVSIPALPFLLTTIFWPSASVVAQTQSIYAANPLQGVLNGIGSFASELPPHLRVQFVLTSMEHIVAEGSGVPQASISWEIHSPLATHELLSGSVTHAAPPPGVVWSEAELAQDLIYDAIVEHGCGSTFYYPVTLTSFAREYLDPAVELGNFSDTDDSTLRPEGIWHFSYVISARDSTGNYSDFRIRGRVSTLCSTQSSDINAFVGMGETSSPVVPKGPRDLVFEDPDNVVAFKACCFGNSCTYLPAGKICAFSVYECTPKEGGGYSCVCERHCESSGSDGSLFRALGNR
jgi:hypothetical protein